MADAVKQQILDAIVAVIKGAGTAAGDSVFVDRVDELPQSALPAVVVEESPEGESVESLGFGGGQARHLKVEVVAVVAQAVSYGKAARALGLEVEKALTALDPATEQPALQALATMGFGLLGARIIPSGDGNKAMAAQVQTWQFDYCVHETTPDVPA